MFILKSERSLVWGFTFNEPLPKNKCQHVRTGYQNIPDSYWIHEVEKKNQKMAELVEDIFMHYILYTYFRCGKTRKKMQH